MNQVPFAVRVVAHYGGCLDFTPSTKLLSLSRFQHELITRNPTQFYSGIYFSRVVRGVSVFTYYSRLSFPRKNNYFPFYKEKYLAIRRYHSQPIKSRDMLSMTSFACSEGRGPQNFKTNFNIVTSIRKLTLERKCR